jgi:hypothetical protein
MAGCGSAELEPRTDDLGEPVQVFGAAKHVEQILIFVTVCAWIFVMAYVVVGNYLYFTKVLPTLSRDGLDGWPKFTPSRQLAQVDLFLTRLPTTAARPWYYGVLSRVRAISAALIVVELVVFLAWAAFASL